MGQKGQYLTKNANVGPNLAVFGPKIHFLEGEEVKLFVPPYQGTNEALRGMLIHRANGPSPPHPRFLSDPTSFVLKTLTGEAPIGRWGRKCAFLSPKFGYLGLKVNFLFWNRDFCQQGIPLLFPGLQLSHYKLLSLKFTTKILVCVNFRQLAVRCALFLKNLRPNCYPT